jgi:hypothetical protein
MGALAGIQNQHDHRLCFIDFTINGGVMHALMDPSASHNFLRIDLAKEIRLRVTPCGVAMKAMKSKENIISGVTSLVFSSHIAWQMERLGEFHSVSYGQF